MAGTTARLTISAELLSAKTDMRRFTIRDRDCRFENELPASTMFSVYHPSLCQYEMALDKARNELGCVPWDVPHLLGEGGSVCYGRTAGEFKRFLHNVTSTTVFEECKPLVCNQWSYLAKVKALELSQIFKKEIRFERSQPSELIWKGAASTPKFFKAFR